MRNLKAIYFLLSALLFVFASCEDTKEVSEYDNWQERNIEFIDSIATVARADNDGKWKVIPATGLDESKEHGNEYNVYCYVLQAGDGTKHPAYTDTVKVNYKGTLINGYIFDSSYDGELEPEFDVPVEFGLIGTVPGFRTAVQHMVAGTTPDSGDIWRVYIPANLGYGAKTSTGIPAYSALIFDINLVSFRAVGTKK